MMTALGTWLQNLMLGLGFGICHQLPERSFIDGGFQQPVCARCSGIYMGATFALITLLWVYRRRRRSTSAGGSGAGEVLTSGDRRTPAVDPDAVAGDGGGAPVPGQGSSHPAGVHWTLWIFLVLALAAMAYDGLSSYLGLRPTTDLLRLITGLAVGGAIAPLLIVLLGETLLHDPPRGKILARSRDWLVFIGALVAAGLLDYPVGRLLGPVIPLVVTLCILATFTAVVLVLVGLVKRFEHSVARIRDALLPTLIACAGALILLAAFAVGKAALLTLL